ncbi:MAG TPA: FAD-dependent oxidoreductase [Gammaproteobacteria bacterium]|nr:FAD-dependent oxidoreductase [Gammaproteobacteria bacterium]
MNAFYEKIKLTKRELLINALKMLTLSSLPFSTRLALGNQHWDLIIVGAGTAGLPTALFASQRGARVLLIEKAATIGGTLYLSTGQIAGAGTVFQEQKGIKDSPEAHYQDIMRINHHTSDPELARLLVNHAGDTINFLHANGYRIKKDHPVTGIAHDHFTTARYIEGVQGGISILNVFKPMVETAIETGAITLLINSGVVDLVQARDGSVQGVIVEDQDGLRSQYNGRNTVLASGGCAANPHLFEELHNVPLYVNAAYPYSQGTGLLLGQSTGGYLRGGEKYASLLGGILSDENYPSPLYGHAPLYPPNRQPWEILVNTYGERFVREDHPSVDHIEHGVVKQPGHRHWVIFDQRMLDESPPIIPGWSAAPAWSAERIMSESNQHTMFKSDHDLEILAVKSGLNPKNLVATVERYNTDLINQKDDVFQRIHRPLPIIKPPFYSIRLQGWALCSFAGLAVNGNLEVIKPSGEPVKNLYAVGEVIGAGTTTGNAYVNGMMVTPAITFGRLLGEQILPLS